MEKQTQPWPQDVEQLHEIIRLHLQQHAEREQKLLHQNQRYQQEIVELSSSLQEKIDEVAQLRFSLQKALMARFGRRSE